MTPHDHVQSVINTLLGSNAHSAVKYVDARTIVRATRLRWKTGQPIPGELQFVVTMGRPNYIERAFIKACRARAKKLFIPVETYLKDEQIQLRGVFKKPRKKAGTK